MPTMSFSAARAAVVFVVFCAFCTTVAVAQESREAVNAIGKQMTAEEITKALQPKPKTRSVKLVKENSVMTVLTFETASSALSPSSKQILGEFGKAAKEGLADVPMVIEGHTDPRGSDQYNTELSRKRAEAVRDYLVRELKVNPKQLTVAAKGKTQQRDLDHPTADINRRVEFVTQNN